MANLKKWDHFGNMLPRVENSESVRPHGEFLVAPWLPLNEGGGVFDKYVEEWFGIMPGKNLAFARDGKVVPAGMLRKWKAASAGTNILKYTTTDQEQKVISLITGLQVTSADVTVNASAGYTKAEVKTALVTAGYLTSTENAEDFISSPVAVAPYAFYNAFSPTDPNNPSTLRYTNFNLQHRVAILCDYVLELPWVPEQASAAAISALGTVTDYTATQLKTYYLAFTDVTKMPIAPSTMRTTWAFSVDPLSLFKNQKNRVRDIRATGDYFVDDDLNRLYFHHGGNLAAASAAANTVNVSLFHYNSTNDGNVAGNYACVLGPVVPGDYLKPTYKSNWIAADKAVAQFKLSTSLTGGTYDGAKETTLNTLLGELEKNAEEQAMILGQVLEIKKHPRDLLDQVRTSGQQLSSADYLDKMPGSATNGLPDMLTYSAGANKTVTVNIIRK